VRQNRCDGVPTCLIHAPRARGVKAWPGNAGARGKTSATACLDAPCARRVSGSQAGTKERPPGTNKGTARSTETIDDLANAVTRRRSARG
jgi:hypothetical protein